MMRKRRVRIETQRGRRATRGDLQMHGGGTSTDGKKCNGRQRDSKREKKSRPLVVKAPSRSLPSAVSLFFAPSFSLSLFLSVPLTLIHSAQLPLYEAPLRRWKQNNSSGPELHNGSGPFFSPIAHFSAHCSARGGKRGREECGKGLRLSSRLYFFRSSC